jgi:hypothetical protein
MREGDWEAMLAEFRALGGTAENICLRNGPFGRGLFAVEPTRPVALRIPDSLLIGTDEVRFENGAFRVAPEANIGARERAFLEAYEAGFAWGSGGGAETAQIFEQAQALPDELREQMQLKYRLGDWFKTPTDALVQEKFINARCIRYGGRKVVMPIVELANHGDGPGYASKSGIGIQGIFSGEILVRYASFDPHGMFAVFGFASEEPLAFGIPLGGRVGQTQVQIGHDLSNFALSAQNQSPRYWTEGQMVRLQFLMIGNKQLPWLCKSVFYKIMRELGRSGYEDAFETMQHANRLHFLSLLAAAEAVEGPMALSLRRVARFQLEAISYCYGASTT